MNTIQIVLIICAPSIVFGLWFWWHGGGRQQTRYTLTPAGQQDVDVAASPTGFSISETTS